MCARRERAAWSHAYLSEEMRMGDIAAPVGMYTPIVFSSRAFHGDVGGTREEYDPCLGMESLSG